MMIKTTAMNEVQVRTVMEEYIGKRKVAKVTEEILEVMQEESKHTHKGKAFYIHTDEAGALVLTAESVIEGQVKQILTSWLEDDEVEDCLRQLMGEHPVNSDVGFETIMVEGSGSGYYTELMKHTPQNDRERDFMKTLEVAINSKVESFRVPVNDPSIDMNGKLQFVSGFKPAVGYSYNELEKLAKENGVHLGTKNEYCLFLGTIIIRLMAEGWSENDAWKAVCCDSKKLGHYSNSEDAKNDFEPTGSRMIAGKCDLANAYKILAKDEKAGGFWLAGGCYDFVGYDVPLADLCLYYGYGNHFNDSVGWFVL